MRFPVTKGLWIASAAVFFASVGLEFYGHACGLLVTSDSLQYLSAAKSYCESGNFLSPDGSYYSYWPPLFPILLSFFKLPESALIGIHIVCKITLVLVLLQIANCFIKDSILKIIFLTASLAGVHVIMISVFIWSELIFMALIFLNAYCAVHIKRDRSFFYGLLVTGFLACLQRNAGLFWISGVSVWLLLDTSHPMRARILQGVGYFLVCSSGLWAWNIYNTFFIPADFSFYNHDFFYFTFPNLRSTLKAFGKMIIPLNGIVGTIVGILFFLTLLFQWVLKRKVDRNAQFLGMVLLCYTLGFLMMPGHLDSFEMDRYFSVITPIVYLFMIFMVQEKTQWAKDSFRVYRYVFICIWLSYPVIRTVNNVQSWHERSCLKPDPENLINQ